MNHRRGLCNLHCVVTVVLGKQLIFKSAVITSKIFLVVSNPYLTYNRCDLHVPYFCYSIHKNNIRIKSSSVNTPCFIMEAHKTHIWLAPLQKKMSALFCSTTQNPTEKQSPYLPPSLHQPIYSNKKLLHAQRSYILSIPSCGNLNE